MAPFALPHAKIFEDPPDVKPLAKYRARSWEDTDAEHQYHKDEKTTSNPLHNSHTSPLGERHINSPPQSRKVPLKTEDAARPAMHKKTGSSTSLKTFLRGREKSSDEMTRTEDRQRSSPKKIKSATNLVGLLKKKSKKDLQENTVQVKLDSRYHSENISPTGHAVVSQRRDNNTAGQIKQHRTLEEEISLYTPKNYSEYRPSEQRNFHGQFSQNSPLHELEPPKRPFLNHKSSRSSIFTENLEESSERQYTQPEQPTPNKTHKHENLSILETGHSRKEKRSSKIFDTIAALNMKSRRDESMVPMQEDKQPTSSQDLDLAMEKMLGRYDIPQNLRDQLRNLKPEVKAGLMKGDRIGSGSSEQSLEEGSRARGREERRRCGEETNLKDDKRSRSRSRTRSRILSLSRRNESSPLKNDTKARSNSKGRPKSMEIGWSANAKGLSSTASLSMLNTADSAVTPGDFIHYLREVQKPALVEVGKIHKLRILLRNESVSWTDAFVKKGGMDEIVQLLYRIMDIEWREEHDDNLLHETLLCLKGLSTTKLAMQRLDVVGKSLFPALLKMLFDPERKGPAEYNTRGVIISLIFSHLSSTMHGNLQEHQQSARHILSILQDAKSIDDRQPLDFVSQMHVSRPYRTWCKEVTNVTKEVFWIFLHHMNVVPISGPVEQGEDEYTRAYFPRLRAPHPAAPYVGGVEWEATQYLALHLDLLNGLIVSLPTAEERNALREELRQSGWEKTMGGSLRTCKEKFYGSVHDGLRSWVSAARQDQWYVEDVRAGPPRDAASPKKSPAKKREMDEAPKVSIDVGPVIQSGGDDGWL